MCSMLEARGLTRGFQGRDVLGPLYLRLEPGERLALTGANGASKSTLVRCIAGTLAPSSGTITVAGHPARSKHAKRCIGASFAHERSFYNRLTGAENLITFATIREARQRATTLAEEIHLRAGASRCRRPADRSPLQWNSPATLDRPGVARHAARRPAGRADSLPRRRRRRPSVGGARSPAQGYRDHRDPSGGRRWTLWASARSLRSLAGASSPRWRAGERSTR